VGKNRVKKKNPLFWGRIPGKLPYFQCSMLTAMVKYEYLSYTNSFKKTFYQHKQLYYSLHERECLENQNRATL